MVSKVEMMQMLHFAMNYEERFLPELNVLMKEKIMEYRLSDDRALEAQRLLKILVDESANHFKLLNEAFKNVEGSDKNAY